MTSFIFFFQAEDGIRDLTVTGVQTCALPISVERVFCNAKIFTAEPDHPYAEAVAIRNGKIVAVGSCAEVKKAAGKDAEFADLHGQSLLPGFIDSHSHFVPGGLSLISADVGDKGHSMA